MLASAKDSDSAAHWKTEDGHSNVKSSTILLLMRSLTMFAEGRTATSCAALREWLPPPAELLRIAEYEVVWLGLSVGGNHPALLCARLHGEWLGDWKVAAEVAEGLLGFERFNAFLRAEAYRLLGRAKAELGERAAACEAAAHAATEAVRGKYAWLEMLSLRDVLRWCDPGETERVRERLRSVVAHRLTATAEEVMEVLGEGVL